MTHSTTVPESEVGVGLTFFNPIHNPNILFFNPIRNPIVFFNPKYNPKFI